MTLDEVFGTHRMPRRSGGRGGGESAPRSGPCGARLLDLAWPGQSCGLGSSLSDLLGRLPARVPSARLSDGAGPAGGVEGRRSPGAPARERGAAPPDRPGPLPAGRPAVALVTVPADPPATMGRGFRGDPGDTAGLAPATGHPPMGLCEPPLCPGRRRPGRPTTAAAIRKLVIQMATDNPTWGHRRGQGELGNLALPIAASRVWQILHDAGIGPAPRRKGPTWKQILTAQARGILAVDFVHVDTVLLGRIYALIVIKHGTRRVHLAGISARALRIHLSA